MILLMMVKRDPEVVLIHSCVSVLLIMRLI
jgi:hypothetical protein